jgi:hypothetical protein
MSSNSIALAEWSSTQSAARTSLEGIGVDHDLQESGEGVAGRLLEAGDRLPERGATGFPVSLVKLGILHPPE